ncbi:hypothetical protein LTR78_007930 [Recurvomyces mirabilis]|uniref:Mannosyl transferase n=1 Tax=Recurvomyces mirabilis TaxID=574656 RepID=A0AAE0TSB0_9PEZI|nr:hypothetical protein LTR78_007930 [Recurvomyces mirabilis]KAK5152465.1 hypothetical protein LTS14_008412 [Recurvomyces mirabilis]
MDSATTWIREQCNSEKMQQISQHLLTVKAVPYLLLALAAILLAVKYIQDHTKRTQNPTRRRSPDPEKPTDVTTYATKRLKPTEREPGNTKPLPYRPFRYGAYNITMGLRTMPWDSWIELDNQFPRFHALKAQRIAERGTRCYRAERSDPRVWDGAVELLEELAEYLPQRYPSLYRKTDVGLDNLLTGESFDVSALTRNGVKEDPILLSARLTQDDLAIMFEKEDGQYYLLSACILLAGFWRLEDKFGMPLSEIHTSGDVPGFKQKLEKGMMNFFRRVQPESPVLRNNYFLQVDDELAWSSSIGSEDSTEEGGIGWFSAEKDRAIKNHYFRSERQSLRRLPRSGGVVFTIRTYFLPVTEIAEEDGVPGRLASAVRSWGEDVSRYKGRERYGDVLLEYLDMKHQEQVERGVDFGEREDSGAYPC